MFVDSIQPYKKHTKLVDKWPAVTITAESKLLKTYSNL